nr:reverse transcriptase domain-containing protein [Tanacetum cinerariifolium]
MHVCKSFLTVSEAHENHSLASANEENMSGAGTKVGPTPANNTPVMSLYANVTGVLSRKALNFHNLFTSRGGSSYAKALIEVRADVELKDNIAMEYDMYRYCKNHKKRAKNQTKRTQERKEYTREDLVNKFVNQFFPPSKTTHLKNEISQFTQRFEKTLGEAWERFKEMLRACPHHGFTELAQIGTFYNGLNDNVQDSLNVAASGNLLSKTTREALQIIENKSKVRYSRNKLNVSRMNTTSRENTSKTDDRIDKLVDQILTLVDIFAKKFVTPASVKAVEESCVTCGGPHAHYNCDATNSNQSSVCVATGTYSQVASQNRASNYMAPPGFALKKLSLPELTHTRMTLELADRSITRPKGVAEDIFVKVGKFHFPTDFVVVDFEADHRVPLILGRSFLRTGRALIDVYGEEITLWVTDEAVTFNLNQTTRYSSIYDDLSVNRIDIINVAREEYAQEILGFSENSSGGNRTSTSEPIISNSSPSLTPFEGSDFILEEIEAYLKDESISPKIDHADYDPEGDICLIEIFLHNDPF